MKYIRRPCDECPWREDAEPGRFEPERWKSLRASSVDPDTQFSPLFGDPLFACHKTPEEGERACAGWLAVEGIAHPIVRLAIAMGDLPMCAIQPGEGWPVLHRSLGEAAAHDLEGRMT